MVNFQSVLEKERKGDYLGKTVQVVLIFRYTFCLERKSDVSSYSLCFVLYSWLSSGGTPHY